MSEETVARIALVHAPVLDQQACATYVARRDAATLFIGSPDFVDDEPSCFRWVSVAAALELDSTLTEVSSLAVGRCAWRSDRSAPWVAGLIPVGSTFLVTYEVRPAESNPERNDLGGAFVSCWVVADTLESALRITNESIAGNDWVIVEQTDAAAVSADDQASNVYCRQARIDGLALVFFRFPKEERELN